MELINKEKAAWLETVLNKYSKENNIRKVLNIEVSNAVPVGDNYLSEIKRATVTVIYTNGFEGKETFIYKQQHSVLEKLKTLDEISLFKAEINIYERVLKYFNQLMNEYQDSNDKLWCNMIGYKPYNLIVFEDLKLTISCGHYGIYNLGLSHRETNLIIFDISKFSFENISQIPLQWSINRLGSLEAQNFKTPIRNNLLDLNHCLLVMHGLGRLHALGYVLLHKGLANKDDFNKHYLEVESPITEHSTAGGLKQMADVMLKEWPHEWHETAHRIAKQETVVVEKLQKLLKMNNDSFQTICHGDVWTCNLMFKYCPYNDTLPIALKFVDFQNTNVNSYVFDILTFLYSSMQPEVRRKNINEILEMYQRTLESTLALYGMKDKAPTLQQIHSETKRAEYYSLVICLTSLPLVCADCDIPFIFENLNFNYNVKNAYNEKIYTNTKFMEAVKDDLKFWMEIDEIDEIEGVGHLAIPPRPHRIYCGPPGYLLEDVVQA